MAVPSEYLPTTQQHAENIERMNRVEARLKDDLAKATSAEEIEFIGNSLKRHQQVVEAFRAQHHKSLRPDQQQQKSFTIKKGPSRRSGLF